MNEWINAYYDEARVKSVSVLDKNNYYVQTEIDCIGIENKNSTSSIRITTYIIYSLVCVGRRKKKMTTSTSGNQSVSCRICLMITNDKIKYLKRNLVFFLRCKVNFTDDFTQCVIFFKYEKRKRFFFLIFEVNED